MSNKLKEISLTEGWDIDKTQKFFITNSRHDTYTPIQSVRGVFSWMKDQGFKPSIVPGKTNLQTNTAKVPAGASLTVTAVCNGVESEESVPFVRKNFDMRNIFVSISFDGSPLKAADFNTAYVWPIDLDGDGEMDYVVNRKSNTNGLDCYVEGYLRTGEHLWTVKLGPNELSCAGQDDMITAADMSSSSLQTGRSSGTPMPRPSDST